MRQSLVAFKYRIGSKTKVDFQGSAARRLARESKSACPSSAGTVILRLATHTHTFPSHEDRVSLFPAQDHRERLPAAVPQHELGASDGFWFSC
jgi:hypothetical protein